MANDPLGDAPEAVAAEPGPPIHAHHDQAGPSGEPRRGLGPSSRDGRRGIDEGVRREDGEGVVGPEGSIHERLNAMEDRFRAVPLTAPLARP